jgi:hypothetical protein
MKMLVIFFFLLSTVLYAWADLSLNVFLDGNSNVVFRVINFSTNTIRLPSAGYTPLAEYMPINTNPAYAIVRQLTVTAGIWLSDAIEFGTNGRYPSPVGVWLNSLKIKTLKPGETLNLVCDPGPWKDLKLTSTRVMARFEFNIPREYGRRFRLWSGDLSVPGPIGTFNLQEEIPAGLGGPCDVAQALYIYDELTDAEVKMQEGLRTNGASLKFGSYPNMTRVQAIAYVEKMMHDQAGIYFKHEGNHVEITLPQQGKPPWFQWGCVSF